jgi:hypothetical protein
MHDVEALSVQGKDSRGPLSAWLTTAEQVAAGHRHMLCTRQRSTHRGGEGGALRHMDVQQHARVPHLGAPQACRQHPPSHNQQLAPQLLMHAHLQHASNQTGFGPCSRS